MKSPTASNRRKGKVPPKEAKAKALTPKQAAFCHEYLIDLNGAQAAIRAGYSQKTARSIATENLSKPYIQAEVAKLMQARAQRVEVDADTVLSELLKLATVDIGEIFNEDGTMKPIHEIPVDVRKAISGIDVFEEFEGRGEDREMIGYTKKIRLWDKTKALEALGRHLKLFTDKHEHSGPNGGPIEHDQQYRPTEADEEELKRIAALRAKVKETQQ